MRVISISSGAWMTHKSRGEKVAPKEVENMLMNIAGVKEAAVIGVPDEILVRRSRLSLSVRKVSR
jgi:acyl-coenzyme A synthetase/AMP-(fatty) acid ligase